MGLRSGLHNGLDLGLGNGLYVENNPGIVPGLYDGGRLNWGLNNYFPVTYSPTPDAMTSFGDSYTTGFGLSSPTVDGYAYLLATNKGLTLDNQAVNGRGAGTMALNANKDTVLPNNSQHFVSCMIGFNDIRKSGLNKNTMNKIYMAHRIVFANQCKSSSVPGGDATVTRTGVWSAYSANGFGGKNSNAANQAVSSVANGATISYTFTGNNIAVGALGADGWSQVYGKMKVEIDSVEVDNFDFNNWTDLLLDANGGSTGLTPIVLTYFNLGAGAHTITLTKLDANLTNVDYFAILNDPASCYPVLVCEIPVMPAAGYQSALGFNSSSPYITSHFNKFAIGPAVESFRRWGYNIGLTTVNRNFIPVQTEFQADQVHPTKARNLKMFNDILKSVI